MGHKFLRHIKRTKSLVHVLGLDSEDIIHDYEVIRKELADYDKALLEKDEIILVSKNDLIEPAEVKKIMTSIKKKVGHDKVYSMTAFDDDSIKEFKKVLISYLENK